MNSGVKEMTSPQKRNKVRSVNHSESKGRNINGGLM